MGPIFNCYVWSERHRYFVDADTGGSLPLGWLTLGVEAIRASNEPFMGPPVSLSDRRYVLLWSWTSKVQGPEGPSVLRSLPDWRLTAKPPPMEFGRLEYHA
jgi:hypothetical protein